MNMEFVHIGLILDMAHGIIRGIMLGFPWLSQLKLFLLLYEPVKTKKLGFQPRPTQTRLYSHRSRLEA